MKSKIMEISFDPSDEMCEASFLEDDFSFDEEIVAGIVTVIIHTFKYAVDDRDQEQFMARVADLIATEFREGNMEREMEYGDID